MQHRKILNLLKFKSYSTNITSDAPIFDICRMKVGQVTQNLIKKCQTHQKLLELSYENIINTLDNLHEIEITSKDAFNNPHIFCMKRIKTYIEIYKECLLKNIKADHIVKYHTTVGKNTIKELKKDGLISNSSNLEETLLNIIKDWPQSCKQPLGISETDASIKDIRMSILERYLNWKVCMTNEEFVKHCNNIRELKHIPFSYIQESFDIAQNNIKLDLDTIRKNIFVIAVDPMNTQEILNNIESIAGMDIRTAIKKDPQIIRRSYSDILDIITLLKEYEIPISFQKRILRIFCLRSETVKSRLEILKSQSEFKTVLGNERLLTLVVHQKKAINRLNNILKTDYYSLNSLVASKKNFDRYMNKSGYKVACNDLVNLINSSLKLDIDSQSKLREKLRLHKFWLNTPLALIMKNLSFLKHNFSDINIYNNCQLLLYPASDVENYVDFFLKKNNGGIDSIPKIHLDESFSNIKLSEMKKDTILSLSLYMIEKTHYFSDAGIWSKKKPSENIS